MRSHVDPCLPPAHKGKVEHLGRTHRGSVDPTRRLRRNLAALQAWKDEQLSELAHLRRCPATGQSVFDGGQAERGHLAPLPQPFEPGRHPPPSATTA